MPYLRRPLTLLIALTLFAGPVLGAEGEESLSRAALEREILTKLATGEAVALQLELYLGQGDVPRRVPRPQSQIGRELRDALAAFEQALPRGEADLSRALAAYEALRGADLLVRDHFQTVARRLEELGIGGEVPGRLAAAESAYLERMERIHAALAAPLAALQEEGLKKASSSVRRAAVDAFAAVRAEIAAALEAAPAPILRASVLPYRPASLAPRSPRTEPTVVPSYLNVDAAPPSADDYASTPEAPLDEAIVEQAAALGHDYVAIYEFVRNEIANEHYAGSMKGALGTLRARAGNDVDQASLLIALLRASQAAGRYVRGVVELPVEDVAQDLGLGDSSLVPAALARAGVAHRGVVRGGRVAAVEVEHTWVEAYVPYTNYRGAVVDFSGRTWLPLAPAIKTSERTPPTGVLRQMDLSVDNLLAERLASVPAEDLLSDLRRRVESHLSAHDPDATYDEQLGTREVAAERLGLLPTTLSAPVVAITGESAVLAEESRVRLRFVARTGPGESDPVALDAELPLAALAGARVTLSYLPATVDDHRTVNAYGGLAGVPLYLVRVRPQIKVQGRPALVGEGSLELGVAHRFEVEVIGPAGTERIGQTVLSGSLHALAVGVQDLPPAVPAEDDLADSESLAASLLAGVGLGFTERWSAGEEELAGLLDVAVVRPLPSLAVTSISMAVEEVLGEPFQLRFEGVTLDAALRVAEPLGEASASRDWMRLSALYGSSLEHRVFEEEFLVASISADKGLGLAREAGVEVLRFEPGETAVLSAHPPAVRADVANWLRLGKAVEIPASPVSYHAWTGSVWRVEDPASGVGGYFLSGGLAGGATSEPPEDWILDFVRDALENAGSSAPNGDPLAGARLSIVWSTSGQEGEVGTVLPYPLTALVTDEIGRPVQGAEVTFYAGTSGGGLLGEGDSGSAEGSSVLVTETDAQGRARARLRLGKHTEIDPVFTYRGPNDSHASQALLHQIEAVATSARGPLTTDEPFFALAYPGEPVSTYRVGAHESYRLVRTVGSVADIMLIAVEDEYGNPVSNVPVGFVVGEPVDSSVCRNRRQEFFQNAVVYEPSACDKTYPLLGECGEASLVVETTIAGANVGVILGNDAVPAYQVAVYGPGLGVDPESGEVTPLRFSYSTLYSSDPAGFCGAHYRAALVMEGPLVYEGHNINASRSGTRFERPIRATLVYWQDDYHFERDAEGEWSALVRTDGHLVRTTGDVEFSVDNGGSVTPAEYLGEGVYQTWVTTGPVPGLHTISAEATDVDAFLYYRPAGPTLTVETTASLWDDLDFNGVISPGDELLYEIRVTNALDKPATSVLLVDPIGPNQTVVPASIESTHGSALRETPVEVEIGELGVGDQAVVSFLVKIADPFPSDVFSVVNQARVESHEFVNATSDDPTTEEPGDATVTPVLSGQAEPTLTVKKFVSLWHDVDEDEAVSPGDVLSYEIEVTNSLDATATSVLLVDPVGPHAAVVPASVSSTRGSVLRETPVVVEIGALAVGDQATVYFLVEIGDPAPPGASLVNQAYVESLEFPTARSDDPTTEAPGDATATSISGLPDGLVAHYSKTNLSGVAAEVYGVEPTVKPIDLDELVLTDEGRVAEEVGLSYSFEPSDYLASTVQFELRENDELIATFNSPDHGPGGASRIHRGFFFDPEQSYELEVVLNRGSLAEVRSEALGVSPSHRLIRRADDFATVSQWVDLPNERVCSEPDLFEFALNDDARVTLRFRRIQSLNSDQSPNLGPPIEFVTDQVFEEGEHALPIRPEELPQGDYEFELEAVALWGGEPEVRTGKVRSLYRTSDNLPIGHTLIHGVDLWSGHLSVSRSDLSVAGRGMGLAFQRTYTSGSVAEAGGVLGVGWTHSYDSRLRKSRCGEIVISGGEGSGMRFVGTGEGTLRPLSGYHGSLVLNELEGSYDFYTKSGNRYVYRQASESEWFLDSIRDPSGNVTRLHYAPGGSAGPRLTSVEDPAGRRLDFSYQKRKFAFWDGMVVTRVSGPDGLYVAFDYDEFGNLVLAEREPHAGGSPSYAEQYIYDVQADSPFKLTQMLVETRNLTSGASTRYTYAYGAIPAGDNLTVGTFHVETVTLPEDGVTSFSYGLLTDGRGAAKTIVTDRRGKPTQHTFNRYGAPLSVTDPEQNTSTMTWALDDVVLESRTDARGHRTDFTYDEHGNVLTETITVTDFEDNEATYTRENTYYPPSQFDPPYVKDRIATSTDRTGAVTTYQYDPKGRLIEERISVTDAGGATKPLVTRYNYNSQGDLLSKTDPRGQTTFFGYDVYGNLNTIVDPLLNATRTEFDVRSRPVRQIDAENHVTTFSYDTLDRLVRRTYADESEERFVYDDAQRKRTEIDPEGHESVTYFDLEGRLVRMENAEGGVKILDYDGEGNKTLESGWFDDDTPRVDVTFAYDDAGRLTRRTEPLGRVTTYGYDAAGNVTRETLLDETDPTWVARVTETEYDELNRPITMQSDLDGTWVQRNFKYDGEDRTVLEVDPLERRTVHRYDEIGRLLETVEPEWSDGKPRVRQNVYDEAGNLVRTVLKNEPADQVREFVYDDADRLVLQRDAEGNETTLRYDRAGNLIQEIDPLLNTVDHAYDERNRRIRTTVRLNRVTDPERDVVTEFVYDKTGNVKEEHWANGNVVVFTYDGLNRLIEVNDSLGRAGTLGYDARDNQIYSKDANGKETESDYDDLDRVVEQRLPENRTVRATYDVAGNTVSMTNARGYTTALRYDTLERLVEITSTAPFLYKTSFTYDAVGNRLTQTDPRGYETSFAYDDLDRLILRTDPPLVEPADPYAVAMTYDAADNLLTQVDRRGILTSFDYDRESRRLRTTRAGLVIEELEYDKAGNVIFVTDANLVTTGFEYDERGLVLAENRPLAAITRYTYDDMGNRISSRDPEGRIVTWTYDLRQRPETLTQHLDGGVLATRILEYDGNGNRTSLKRPEGGSWTYVYDGANRLVSVEDPAQKVSSFEYDENDNLYIQADANQNPTVITYDELDRPTILTYPDTTYETSVYDPNGNVELRTDAKGQVTGFEYDPWNRQTRITYPADPATDDDLQQVIVTYDPNNNVTQVTESYETGPRFTTQTYDDFDRPETVTDRWGHVLRYAYDANGNRTQLIDPQSKATSYAYDELNRLTSVTTSAGGAQYDYYRNSYLKQITYPNGTTSSYTYDLANRVRQIENRHNTALVSSFQYTYDRNGNRVEQVETHSGLPSETTTYEYDSVDRLTDIFYPEKTTSYTYDDVGNRETEKEWNTASTAIVDKLYSYNSRNQLESMNDLLDSASSVTYDYDANGNQSRRTVASGVVTDLVWDVRDRLVEVTTGGTSLGRYGYDAQGLRVTKTTAAGTTRYVYDQDSVLQRIDGDGTTKYEYGPDRLLSVDHPTAGRAFYLFDGMGSVVNLMTPQGTVLGRYQWDAWGNKRASVETAANPFGFTGHEHDEETGLVYAKARFYDPQLGLFLSQDPVAGDPMNPPSLHRYLYGFQNPTVYVDPDGRIEFLRKLKEKFTEAAEDAIELAEEIGKESKIAGILAAVPLGVVAASAELVGGAIGTVNTVTNVAIAASGAEGRLADEAALEISETIDSVKTTVKAIVENPGAVAAAVVDGVVETAKGVLEGDAGAIARATKTITSIALPAPGAGATKLAGALTKAVKKGGAVAARAGWRVARAAAGKTFQALRKLGGTRLGKVAKVISGKTRHLRNKVRGLAHRLRRWTANRVRGRSAEPTYCFVAGTLVDTELGLRPIEEIEVGDRVWSRDEETGEIGLQPVTKLFVTPSQETLELELESSDGTIETLGATYGHPFWVEGQGWTPAGELVVGDVLFTERDGWLRVRQVRGSPGVRTVYNLEVKEDHNYFVGYSRAWVHNRLCDEAKRRIKREFKETGAVDGIRPSGSFQKYVAREQWAARGYNQPKALRSGGTPNLTREQAARFRGTGRERGEAFNQHLTQVHQGVPEVGVQTQLGLRRHDVARIPTRTSTELVVEGKNYLRYRRIRGGPTIRGSVPLSPEIHMQIHKDVLWIRAGRKLGIHRVVQWEFAGAGPDQNLTRALQRWGLPYVE